MDLKADIRQAIEKFANDSGYSGSIVEPYAVEIANLIDILGDTKYTELAALVYRISAGLQGPENGLVAGGTPEKGGAGAYKLSPELKAAIIALIREEFSRDKAPEQTAEEKQADKAAEPDAPFDLEAGKKYFEEVSGKIISCVAEDISTLINEKLTQEFQGTQEISGPEIIKAKDVKYITIENLRDQGPKMIFRVQAKSLVRIAGVKSGMDKAVIEEKMTSLNLTQGDMDAIKEVCNQVTGSVNRAIPAGKSSLGSIITFDEAAEKTLFGEGRFIVCRYKMGSSPESMGSVEIISKTEDSLKL